MSSPSTPSKSARSGQYAAHSVISGHLDTRTAAMEVAEQLHDGLGGTCDMVLLFGSYHHRAALADAGESIRQTLSPEVLLATTAEAVVGGDEERDGLAGLAAIGMQLGGARLTTWTTTPNDPLPLRDPEALRRALQVDDEFRAAIFLADPFSTPITRLLPALTDCGDGRPVPIVGGMASGGTQPGLNVLMCNEELFSAGGVGVSIGGPVEVDFVVSQGCRPIGQPHVITKAQQNVVLELGGRKALAVLKETAQALPEHERALLNKGLLTGTVINEYKDRFGRGDFLVRNVLGFHQQTGGIAVGEMPRVGQTIQFHVRDAATAAEDLQLLLDAQQFDQPPFGAALFTCNGRGERLFEEPNHDLSMIHDRLDKVPVAGFFAAGEIGPIGERSFLHGHTASLTLFRARN